METEYYEVAGENILCDHLVIPRARDFARLVRDGASPHVRLLNCRRTPDAQEAIIIEVQATIPQEPAIPLNRIERLKVQFNAEDNWYPDVRALRRDFPRVYVLHLNLVSAIEPASLCLFVAPWSEVRLRLTANELLFRIQTWLNDSADGTLHREDQPLEPAFLGNSTPLIISSRLTEILAQGVTDIELTTVDAGGKITFIERRPDRQVTNRAPSALVIPIVSKTHHHCIMNNQPRNLEELHRQLESTGINLLEVVQTKLFELESRNQLKSRAFLVLLLILLRQRSIGAEPEPEMVAFFCMGDQANQTGLTSLARAVGLTGTTGDNSKRGQDAPVLLMDVHRELTQQSAALYSGNDQIDVSLVGIGGGALGSQVIMTSVRGGLGHWVVIDKDYLFPHNLVRHSLSGVWLGHPKAEAIAFEANALLNETTVQSIVADVLKPGDRVEAVEQAIYDANAIIDLSASVAVARHLALDVSAVGKRCSIFVSPSGKDLVFLGENADRAIRLDHIEAQYYRAIASNPRLTDHLLGGSTIGSCRNITSRVPQHLMGLHAAFSVRLLREWLLSDKASAKVVRTEDNSTSCAENSFLLGQGIDVGILGDWSIQTDNLFLDELREQRRQCLPDETGGVLLAHVDAQRRIVYVCHQIPAPHDSERQPTMYIRGSAGLENEYERIQKNTLYNLIYIGEWHSHPDGCQCAPSDDDLKAGAWLAEKTRTGSLPGIMLIVGEKGQTCWMLCSQPEEEAPIHLFFTRR